jgi:hypothetical protein
MWLEALCKKALYRIQNQDCYFTSTEWVTENTPERVTSRPFNLGYTSNIKIQCIPFFTS